MNQAGQTKLPSEAALRKVGENFCGGTISRSDWTHQAHIAAAVYLIALRPDIEPELEMPKLIRELNIAHGTANTPSSGYHHTITIAFLSALRAFMLERQGLPPHEIVNRAMESPFRTLDWLLDYWSKNLLFSSQARRQWVEPDQISWPFLLKLEQDDHCGGERLR